MACASARVIGVRAKRNVGAGGCYAARESETGTTGTGSNAAAILTSSSLTSTSSPLAMLSSTLEEGSFSPRSISARYETETCAPSATCFNVSPRSLRSARRVSPMVERRSPACRSGLISKVFTPLILSSNRRFAQPTCQLLDQKHLFGVSFRGLVRRLHDHGNSWQTVEKPWPGVDGYAPFPHFAMPIAVAPEFVLRIVEVNQRDRPSDGVHEILSDYSPSAFRRQVVAGHESVGRVNADPHPAAPRHLPEILERRAELGTGPDGVLDDRFGCASVESGSPLPSTPQAFYEPLHALLLAVSPVAASVHDYQVDPERACGGQLVGQGQHRKFPLLLARGGKVYKVLRVCDDRRDAKFTASLDEGIGVLASPGVSPGLRVGEEDLDSLAPELARGPKGSGEPTGGRKVPSYSVRPLWHGGDSTGLRRPSPGEI